MQNEHTQKVVKNILKKRTLKSEENSGNREKKSQSDLLLEIVEKDTRIRLFHDDLKESYVQFPVKNHLEIWKCRSKAFKQWLAKIYWETHKKAPNSDALNTALNVIEAKAIFDSPQHKLWNRVAWHEDVLWYDLCNEEWQAVRISEEGWSIFNTPPILFKRHNHQQAQVLPASEGNFNLLLEFININDDDHKLILLVWIVSCFIPDFPHPIPFIYGAQGSAKSTLSRILRKLIDPSVLETSGFPKNIAELVQQLSHHWCIIFDNISQMPEWISDEFCKAVTGGGFSKRELYTDDDDIMFSFKRCIGINGINLVATKPDLMERGILFELHRISPENRMQEKELWKKFDSLRPQLLSGIFHALSHVLRIKNTISIAEPPRMADFSLWGCAIAEALEYTQEAFLSAYSKNIKSQNEEVLYENVVAICVVTLLEERDEWEGTPSELLDIFRRIAEEKSIDPKDPNFPKAANALSAKLNQLKTNLAEEGISIQKFEEKRKRVIRIQKIKKKTVETDVSLHATAENGKTSNDTSIDHSKESPPISIPSESTSSLPCTDDNDGDDENHSLLEGNTPATLKDFENIFGAKAKPISPHISNEKLPF
ncbi:hypothetical protein HZA38_03035 [Candidatus Peregrinibacteria bacterium]|nr:hypothetical protein [Candidatus Peregrinibacteria bacterium]